jgi:aspartyl protease family protein
MPDSRRDRPTILRRRALWPLGLALAAPAWAQAPVPNQVHLNGVLGSRAALLVIDGEPRTLQVGNSAAGVKLIAVEGQNALIEVAGRRFSLQMGAAPGRVGVDANAAPSRQIVLAAGPGGHFTALGSINGRTTQFLVDTGATSIAIGQPEAERLGLPYRNGRRIQTQTANGAVPALLIQLASVRIGDVEVHNVDAIVVPAQMSHILLGNSFLTRFQMRRENDVMTLEQRY